MRTLVTTLALSAVLGGLAYAGIFFWQKSRIDERHAHQTAFEWFCEEFAVDDNQRSKIEALHTEYFPGCADHCVHYADTRETLAKITGDPNLNQNTLHKEASMELSTLKKEADKQFIDFIYKIASELEPSQSERYLRRMKGWLDRS